ncbi:GGDEF domain-containing protein [Fervidobacterium sp.]
MIFYLLIIALESASGIERKAYKNIIIASAFMILSLLQFVYRESSGSVVTYLIFEQFARTTPMFVLTFLLFAIVELASLRERIGKTLKTTLIAISIILISTMLFSTQIKYIHLIGAISDFYALILLLAIILLIAKYRLVEFIFPVTFMFLTGIQTFYVLISKKSSELMIHYGRIVFLIYVGTITLRKFKEISITHEKLKKENLIDHLTGVFNRKAIDIIPKGGTLVLVDLDGFKKINDKYGHIHGDMILKKFAEIINANIRTGDYFIRLGGDEFCIVFKTVKVEDIPKVMERLYNECRNHLGLGFWYGYSEFDDFDKAYDAADRMMYENKEIRYKLEK